MLYASLVAQIAASNTSADVPILTYVIPANSARAGARFHFDFSGGGSVTQSGTGMLAIWIAVNGAKIATVSGAFIGATTNGAIDALGSLTFRTIGNASSGTVIARLAAKFFSSGQVDELSTVPNVATAIDTTQPITLSFGMTWSAAVVTNVATFDHGIIEQVA